MSTPLFTIILTILVATHSQAAQNVHTHGTGQWHIISTEDRLVMTMKLPAMSIIGFEHMPTTNKEKNIIDAAKKILQAPTLFAFYGPSKITKQSPLMPPTPPLNVSVKLVVDSPNITPHDDHHNPNAHHDLDTPSETHAEFHATFEYKKPNQLSRISTTLFNHFNGIKKIEATIITDPKQSSAIVTNDTPSIRL